MRFAVARLEEQTRQVLQILKTNHGWGEPASKLSWVGAGVGGKGRRASFQLHL